MDWTKAHKGDVNQVTGEENPKLKAPKIELPGDTAETNLHGDVPGSPYSATPGEMSLAEARARAGDPEPAPEPTPEPTPEPAPPTPDPAPAPTSTATTTRTRSAP